jgi:hypothetical protein
MPPRSRKALRVVGSAQILPPWIPAPRFRRAYPRGNDGYAGRLPFAVAKVAQCLAGFLHSRAVRGQLREEPGEDEGGER